MKDAKAIVENAKREIIDIICTMMRKIDGYRETGKKRLMTTEGNEIVLLDEEFLSFGEMPRVKVNYYTDFYSNEQCEEVSLNELCLNADGSLEFFANNHDKAINPIDLTSEELMTIAYFLNGFWEVLP